MLSQASTIMRKSNSANRLPNWAFDKAIRRKLRLPIFKNHEKCKCGVNHNLYGDHTFHCRCTSKKLAHNIIRDTWATALQPALATAGYIHHNSKLDIERKRILSTDLGAQPFDFSFDPDPLLDTSYPTCPYQTIGADITIAHSSSQNSSFDISDNAIPALTAFANQHLQRFERKKFMRCDKQHSTLQHIVKGEGIMKELLEKQMILLPFAIDPLGRWGPITTTFLQGNKSSKQYTFQKTRNNAALMFERATSTPCPLGILRTADANWKQNKKRNFFGFSYRAPTPAIHTMQQLGLGITKAFSLHIQNASKEFDSTADTAETNFPTTIDN